RDVEALDAHRDLLHTELLLEALECLDALHAAMLRTELVLVEGKARVALGKLEDAALVASFRVPDLDRGSPLIAERLLEDSRARERGWGDDLRRDRRRGGVVLEDELLGDLGLVAAALVLEIEALTVGENAVAYLEDLGVGVGALGRDGHGVERADRLVRDAL